MQRPHEMLHLNPKLPLAPAPDEALNLVTLPIPNLLDSFPDSLPDCISLFRVTITTPTVIPDSASAHTLQTNPEGRGRDVVREEDGSLAK